MAQPERRVRRTSEAVPALTRLLDAVRTRHRLEALVVATDEGLVFTASGAFAVCEELAAVPTPGVELRLGRDRLVVRALGPASERGLGEVVAGCGRILGTRAA